MADGIGGFIDDILGAIGDGADAIGRKVWAAVTSIWNVSTDFWWRILVEHSFAADVIRTVRNWAQSFIGHVFTTLKWIITTAIPRFVQNAVDTLSRWVSRLVDELRNAISSVYHTIVRWATDLFNRVSDYIRHVENWATHEISSIWNNLRAVIAKVNHFLTDPFVLVEWFWDAIIAKTKRWVRENEEFFARWFLARIIGGTVRLARVLEDLIIRIL